MNKQGHITAVGLGPGEPELITLKAYNTLKQADIIFYPASSIKENEITSFSLQILNALDLDNPLKPLHLPMKSKNRELYYQKAYELIKNEYVNGCNIAIVSEGDILFYSTFGYLLKYIQNDDLKYSIIPGIPAFIASASEGKRPLVEGTENLKVVSCPENLTELTSMLKEKCTLVIMKLSKIENWDTFFETIKKPFLYAERVGTEKQFITNRTEDVTGRDIPYFSLMIIYN